MSEVREALKASSRETRLLFLALQKQIEELSLGNRQLADSQLDQKIRTIVDQRVAESSGKIITLLTKERDLLDRERKTLTDNLAALREERRNLEALMDELKKYGINVLRAKSP